MKKTLLIALALIMAVSMAAFVLTGCGQSESKKSEEEVKEDVLESVVPPEGFELEGSWQDENSQRAMMDIKKTGAKDEYEVLISWGSSATESTSWQFTGTFDREGGFLYYKNCVKTNLTFDENDKETAKTEYKDGEGAISYLNGKLKWQDKKEDAGKDCLFVKE